MSEALPRGWVTVPLRSVGCWAGGGTPSKAEPRYWTNGTIPWVSPKDMKVATLHDAEDHITEEAVRESATRVIEAGSVLIVTRSGILQRILPVAVNAVPVALNQDMKAITPHESVDARYLYWMLVWLGDDILRTCTKSGTTVASVEIARLHELPIPLAPLPEQHRIVAALEEHLSALDAAVAGLVRARANAQRFALSVREYALQACEKVPLIELLEAPLSNGRSVPTSPDGFPVLRLTALKNGRVDLEEHKQGAWTYEDAKSVLVSEGDFMIARGNGSKHLVGRGGLVGAVEHPVAYPDTMIRVRVRGDRILPNFMRIVWDSRAVRTQIETIARTTAGIYKVNQHGLEQILVPICENLEDQQAIVQQDDTLFGAAQRGMLEIELQLARAARLRQSILQRAFSGGLVPQDPAEAATSIVPEPEPERAERSSAPVSSRPARGRGRTARTGSRRG